MFAAESTGDMDTSASSVSGLIIGTDERPASGITVHLINPYGSLEGAAVTDELGGFTITDITAGRYTLTFHCGAECAGSYRYEAWGDASGFETASFFGVGAGTHATGFDAILVNLGSVAGTVADPDGRPLAGMQVTLTALPSRTSSLVRSDTSGAFRFKNLEVGQYTMQFHAAAESGFLPEYWDDKLSSRTATTFELTDAQQLTGMDARLRRSATLAGQITDQDGIRFPRYPGHFSIFKLSPTGSLGPEFKSLIDKESEFRMVGLEPGRYVLCFDLIDWGGSDYAECWQDKPTAASAEIIELTEGQVTDFDVILAEGGPVRFEAPKVVGTAHVGESLSAAVTTITPAAVLSYQWLADGAPIAGATEPSLRLTAAQLGTKISVSLTGAAPDRLSITSTSSETAAVQAGVLSAPIPKIMGEPHAYGTLTADLTGWTPGTDFTYEWWVDGSPMPVSTGVSFTPTPAHIDQTVSVKVVGTQPGYTPASGWSASYGPIVRGPGNVTTPLITGSPTVGSTLRGSASSTVPDAEFGYEWLADGAVIPEEIGSDLTLSNALLGRRISVRVSAWGLGHAAVAKTSNMTAAVTLPSSWGKVSRLAGSDRYTTAVAISKSSYSPGVPVAYLASGAGFADALAGAPAAAKSKGPILLTDSESITPVALEELKRLRPDRIVLLGGQGVISYELGVKLELMDLAPTYRSGGDDRYSTAVEISKSTYQPGVPVVYVASGASFPDALAGAPVAGHEKGPILLSGRGGLPSVVTDELRRLRPAKIVILGGTGVIDSRVASQLENLTEGTVTRLAGTDRYATSAAISKSTFVPGVPVAYIASGTNFPDALAGAPVAGMRKGPVLLTERGSVPKVVLDELKRLRPAEIVILGGSGAVNSTVQAQLSALG